MTVDTVTNGTAFAGCIVISGISKAAHPLSGTSSVEFSTVH